MSDWHDCLLNPTMDFSHVNAHILFPTSFSSLSVIVRKSCMSISFLWNTSAYFSRPNLLRSWLRLGSLPNIGINSDRSTLLCANVAMYHLVKFPVGKSSKICSSAPIFLKSKYFRQKIWRLSSPSLTFDMYLESSWTQPIICNLWRKQEGCE